MNEGTYDRLDLDHLRALWSKRLREASGAETARHIIGQYCCPQMAAARAAGSMALCDEHTFTSEEEGCAFIMAGHGLTREMVGYPQSLSPQETDARMRVAFS